MQDLYIEMMFEDGTLVDPNRRDTESEMGSTDARANGGEYTDLAETDDVGSFGFSAETL